MLLTSYFVPHSPVLISRIGKEHTALLDQTNASYDKIKAALTVSKPDSIIILSAHAPVETNTINFNLHQAYKLDLSTFGDLTTKHTWRPDIETLNHLGYESAKLYDTNTISEETLDYGSAIPLHLLTEEIPAVKIIPITFADLSLKELYRFGSLLEKELSTLNKRYVILATGDLSHRLSKDSPSGFSKHAEEYDTRVRTAITDNTLEELCETPNDLLQEVGQCGLRSLLILAGAMAEKNVTRTVLSYDASLGIGYLTASFELT